MNTRNILLIIAFIGILIIPSHLYSFTTWYTKYGDNYIPVPMYADQDGNPLITGEFPPLRRGGRTWNQVSGSYFSFYFGGWYNGGVPVNDNKNQNIFDYLDPGILGTAWLVTNGPNREVDIKFDMDTPWNVGPDPTQWTEIDLESVACHEFGHNLGLGHSSVSQATMYAYINYGDDSKRTLHQDDIDGITYLYPSARGVAKPSDFNGLTAGYGLKVSSSNDNARISFSLNNNESVKIRIFDAVGRVVQTLVDQTLSEGEHTYNWNTNNVRSGIYFVSVETPQGKSSEKFVVLK